MFFLKSQSQSFRKFKWIALFLAFCMVFDHVNLYAENRSFNILSQALFQSPDFEIPKHLGDIQASYDAGSGRPKIIFIQDAHDSLEAQENIAEMIQYLVNQKNVTTVFEEGYDGIVPTDDYFKVFGDAVKKQKAAYFLMDQLRLGGAEYAHINRKKDFKLIGVDHQQLHAANIEAYHRAAQLRDDIDSQLDTIEREMQKLLNQRLSSVFRDWIRIKERLDKNEMPLLDYLVRIQKFFTDTVKDESFDENYPSISCFLKSVDHLTTKGKKEYSHLYNRLEEVFHEIHQLEKDYVSIHLSGESERKIFFYYTQIKLLRRLNAIEITEEEYRSIRALIENLKTNEMADFIVSQGGRSFVFSDAWESQIKHAKHFYEVAQQRDLKLEERLIKALPMLKEDEMAVLVFGGFHRESIQNIFRKHRISYEVIAPKIKTFSQRHQKYYKQLMGVGYHDFELPLMVAQAAKPHAVFTLPYGRTQLLKINEALDAIKLDNDLWLRELRSYLSASDRRSELRAQKRRTDPKKNDYVLQRNEDRRSELRVGKNATSRYAERSRRIISPLTDENAFSEVTLSGTSESLGSKAIFEEFKESIKKVPGLKFYFNSHNLDLIALNLNEDALKVVFPLSEDIRLTIYSLVRDENTGARTNIFKMRNNKSGEEEIVGYMHFSFRVREEDAMRDASFAVNFGFDIFPAFRSKKDPRFNFDSSDVLETSLRMIYHINPNISLFEILGEKSQIRDTWVNPSSLEGDLIQLGSKHQNAHFYLNFGFYPEGNRRWANQLLQKKVSGQEISSDEFDALIGASDFWIFPVLRSELRGFRQSFWSTNLNLLKHPQVKHLDQLMLQYARERLLIDQPIATFSEYGAFLPSELELLSDLVEKQHLDPHQWQRIFQKSIPVITALSFASVVWMASLFFSAWLMPIFIASAIATGVFILLYHFALKVIAKEHHRVSGLKILDVGMGDGFAGRVLSEYTQAYVTAIELDPERFQYSVDVERYLKSRGEEIQKFKMLEGDFLQHSIADYDVIYQYFAAPHIKNREESEQKMLEFAEAILEKLDRELKPGSVFVSPLFGGHKKTKSPEMMSLLKKFPNLKYSFYSTEVNETDHPTIVLRRSESSSAVIDWVLSRQSENLNRSLSDSQRQEMRTSESMIKEETKRYSRLENFLSQNAIPSGQNQDGTLYVPTPLSILQAIHFEFAEILGPLKGKHYLSFGAGGLVDALAAASLADMRVTAIEKDQRLAEKAQGILQGAIAEGIEGAEGIHLHQGDAFQASWQHEDVVFFFYTQSGGSLEIRTQYRKDFEKKLQQKIAEMKAGSVIAFLFTGTQLMAGQDDYDALKGLENQRIQVSDAMTGLYLDLYRIPERSELRFNEDDIAVDYLREVGGFFIGEETFMHPEGLTHAIKDFFLRDKGASTTKLVTELFGENYGAADVKNLQLQNFQFGQYFLIFKGTFELLKGEQASFTFVSPSPVSLENNQRINQEYELLLKYHRLSPKHVVKPYLKASGSTGKQGEQYPAQNINFYTSEFLPDFIEMNPHYLSQERVNFFMNASGRENDAIALFQLNQNDPETHESIVSEIVRIITELTEYDEETQQFTFPTELQLLRGDMMLRPGGKGKDLSFDLKLIAIRSEKENVSVLEYFAYLLNPYFGAMTNSASALSPRSVFRGLAQGLVRQYGIEKGSQYFEDWLRSYVEEADLSSRYQRQLFEVIDRFYAQNLSASVLASERNLVDLVDHSEDTFESESRSELRLAKKSVGEKIRASEAHAILLMDGELLAARHELRTEAFAVAYQTKVLRHLKLIIYNSEKLGTESYKNFSALGHVKLSRSNVRIALKEYGHAKSFKRVHLIGNSGERMLPHVDAFLWHEVTDIWAALIYALSDDDVLGISKVRGVYRVVNEFFRRQMQEYRTHLIIRMSA